MFNNIGLGALTSLSGIHDIVFHNAGNDAMATMIMAILMVIDWSRRHTPPGTDSFETSDGANFTLEHTATSEPAPISNTETGSEAHLVSQSSTASVMDTHPTSVSSNLSINDLVLALMNRPYPENPTFGSFTHCTGCDSHDHLAADCSYFRTTALECKRCHGNEHITKMCMVKEWKLAQKIRFHDRLLGPLGVREYLLR